jgi:single-strand DNA-binding protein
VRDPLTGQWTDGATLWFTVKTWRDKARNVAHSLRKGDPVVVTGRLMVDEWTSDREVALPDGTAITVPEQRYKLVIEAQHVGPDATRGLVRYAPVVDRGSWTERPSEAAPAPRVEDPWSTPAEATPGSDAEADGGVPDDVAGLADQLAAELSEVLEEDRVGA